MGSAAVPGGNAESLGSLGVTQQTQQSLGGKRNDGDDDDEDEDGDHYHQS